MKWTDGDPPDSHGTGARDGLYLTRSREGGTQMVYVTSDYGRTDWGWLGEEVRRGFDEIPGGAAASWLGPFTVAALEAQHAEEK